MICYCAECYRHGDPYEFKKVEKYIHGRKTIKYFCKEPNHEITYNIRMKSLLKRSREQRKYHPMTKR